MFGVSGGGSDFPDEVKEKIPLTDPYCTNVEFHREKDVCRLISAILPLFPEMYVIDDGDSVCAAKEYIATRSGN